jgi:hypothetical protein
MYTLKKLAKLERDLDELKTLTLRMEGHEMSRHLVDCLIKIQCQIEIVRNDIEQVVPITGNLKKYRELALQKQLATMFEEREKGAEKTTDNPFVK